MTVSEQKYREAEARVRLAVAVAVAEERPILDCVREELHRRRR